LARAAITALDRAAKTAEENGHDLAESFLAGARQWRLARC
jgi:hypothetical protein